MYVEGCWSMANGIKPWGTSNTQVTPTTMTSFDSAVWFNNSAYWSGGPGSASGEGYKLGESFDESVQNTTNTFFKQLYCL